MNLWSLELSVEIAHREPSQGKKACEPSLLSEPVASPTVESCPEPGILLSSPTNDPLPFLPLYTFSLAAFDKYVFSCFVSFDWRKLKSSWLRLLESDKASSMAFIKSSAWLSPESPFEPLPFPSFPLPPFPLPPFPLPPSPSPPFPLFPFPPFPSPSPRASAMALAMSSAMFPPPPFPFPLPDPPPPFSDPPPPFPDPPPPFSDPSPPFPDPPPPFPF